MATSTSSTKSKLIAAMVAQGFDPLNVSNNGQAEAFLEAIAQAIVDTIKDDAEVNVTSGSSAGTYSVQ